MASAITMAHRFVPTKVLRRTRSLLLEQGKVIAAVAIMVEGATAGDPDQAVSNQHCRADTSQECASHRKKSSSSLERLQLTRVLMHNPICNYFDDVSGMHLQTGS